MSCSALLIIMHLGDIVIYPGRQEMPDILFVLQGFTYEGGGYLHEGSGKNPDILMPGRINRMTWPWINIPLVILFNEPEVLPFSKCGQPIRSHDQNKFLCRILFLQIGQCINRKGWLGQSELNVAYPEPVVFFNGYFK